MKTLEQQISDANRAVVRARVKKAMDYFVTMIGEKHLLAEVIIVASSKSGLPKEDVSQMLKLLESKKLCSIDHVFIAF